MRKFKDQDGRTWIIRLDVAAVERLRALCGIDPLSLKENGFFAAIDADPLNLIGAAYAICKEQCDAAFVTAKSFCDACRGDPLDELPDLIAGEIIDFFPRSRRLLLAAAWLKTATDKKAGHNNSEIESSEQGSAIQSSVASMTPQSSA